MAEQPGAHSAERQYAFAVALTIYSALKQTPKGRTTAKRQEKSVKTKELHFPLDENNYIEFLESILEKHGKTQYKVSSMQWFSFKYIVPKIKRYDPPIFPVAGLTNFYLVSVQARQWM